MSRLSAKTKSIIILLLCICALGCKGGGASKQQQAFVRCKEEILGQTSVHITPEMTKKEKKKITDQLKENARKTCGEIKTACKNKKSQQCKEMMARYL